MQTEVECTAPPKLILKCFSELSNAPALLKISNYIFACNQHKKIWKIVKITDTPSGLSFQTTPALIFERELNESIKWYGVDTGKSPQYRLSKDKFVTAT